MKRIIVIIGISFLLFWGCSDDKTTNQPPVVDITPIEVISTVPPNGATDVSLSDDIEFYFNEPFDDSINFKVTIDPSIVLVIDRLDSSISFRHLEFEPLTQYTFTLDSIYDMAGNMISQPDTIVFTTIHEQTPPKVVQTYPDDSSKYLWVDTSIHIIFSEPLDSSTVNSNSVIIDPLPVGYLSYANQMISFYPDTDFEYYTHYNITVTTDITDTIGNHLEEDFTFTFLTTPASLVGHYFSGVYIYCIDYGLPSEIYEEFTVELHFTEDKFYLTSPNPNICDATCEFKQFNDHVYLSTYLLNCSTPGISKKTPDNVFYYELIGDSLHFERLFGDTLKSFSGHITK